MDSFWKIMVISYMIVVLVDDRRKFRLTLLVMCISLSFEAAKQGWANLYFNPGGANNNKIPFLGDNNGVALGLMMLLPLIGALGQTSGRAWERNMHRFLGVGVLLRGISTYSRGGFLGAATLVVILVARAEKRLRAAFVVGVLAAGIVVVMPQDFWDRMDTITIEEGEVRESSSAARLHFWTVAVDMANAKPWTGVGLFAFNNAFMTYNTDEEYKDQERAAHSIWFGVLGDLGYTGLVLFVLNFGAAFWACWFVHRRTRGRPDLRDLRIYANALISSLTVYAVTGSFLSHQYNEMAWHIFAMTAALRLIAIDRLNSLPVTEATPKAA